MACCAIIVVLLSLYMATAVSGQVATITALPAGFFTASSAVNIATGSVVQVFCTVHSSDVVFTWDRSGTVLTNDPPHTRIRSNSDASSTTSILTVDDFQAADSGVYQCSAGGAMATTQILTAFAPANPDDTLFMFRQPRDRESLTIGVGQPLDNRTALALGANTETPNTYGGTRLLRCVAFHTNDADQPLGIFDWTVNGRVLSTGDNGGRITITPVVFGTRYGSDLMITAFEVTDAGIYQCIAMDAPSSDSDIFLGLPFRFDTDIAVGGNSSVLRLERVSPEEILLTPPNKLVIEVKASGRYEEITWSKDGMPFGDEGDSGVFVVDRPNELPNFAEIFVRGETTSTDAGTYTVASTAFDVATQTIDPVSLQFTVVATVAPNTTADGPTMVTVNETDSVNISCTSTGLPTPGIQWTVGGVAARFEQVDTTVEAVGSTPGCVTSVLKIISAVPNDIGTYTCTGSSSVDGVLVGNSSDSIVVMVHVANPIPPMASALQPDPVILGALIELACVATNGTPPLTFTWTRDSDGMEVFSSATSGVYSFTVASDNTGLFICNISNLLGSDTTSVTVVLGIAPTGSTNQSQHVSVVVGANLTLAVDITGFNQPLTSVTWRRGATQLTNATTGVTIINSDLSISPATSMLTVSPVVSPSADAALYTVTAESPAGTSDVSFDVDVFAPPTITDRQEDMTVDEGAVIAVKCTASGFPAPSFVWLQGTTQLMDGLPRITIVAPTFNSDVEGFRVVTSTLSISSANHSDAGSYACVASNSEPGVVNGEARDDFTITVNFIGGIVEGPVDTVVQAPDPLALTCTASGVPQPDVTWTKTLRDGSTVLYTTSADNVNVTNTYVGVNVTSTLTIYPTDRNFTANSSCRASNFIGSTSESSQAQVIIAVRPTVLAPTEGEVFSVNEGGNLTVACSASGVITPSIEFQQVPSGAAANLLPRVAVGGLSAPMQTGDGDSIVSRSLTLSSAEDNDTRNLSCVPSIFFSKLNVTLDDSVQFAVGVNIMVNITGPPMNRTVTSPAPAVFACVATGFPRPEIIWCRRYTNGTEEELLDSDADVAISEAGIAARTVESMLTMLSTLPRDGFEYVCNASNLVNSVLASAQLTVYDVPSIEFPMENFTYTVDEFTSVTFACGVFGVPGPNISWYRNANQLTTELDIRISFTAENDTMIDTPRGPLIAIGRTLTFTQVFDNDSDIYTCRAVNDAVNGTAEQRFELIVRVAPEITVPPDNVTATQPGNATVTCSATGRPAPIIRWFRLNENGSRDVELVTSDGSIVATELLGMRSVQSTLTLLGVSPSDAGSYSCLAENDLAGDGASAEFTVTVHVAPEITTRPENVTVVQPATSTFTCMATGLPRPVITWFFEDSEGSRTEVVAMDGVFTLPVPFGETVVQISLTFDRTAPNVAGLYVCVAENIVNSAEASAVLTVHVTPVILFPEDDAFTYIANVTKSVTFFCNTTGIPPPSIQWLRSGTLLGGNATIGVNSRVVLSEPMQGLFTIDGEGDMFLVERTITVDPVALEDDGTFTCSAMNVANTDSQDFQLFVQVPPLVVAAVPTISTNESNTETLNFRVDNARPDVVIGDLTWYFSRDFADSRFGSDAVDITDQPENAPGSTLTFSSFMNNEVSLTITNIVQGRSEGDPTDAGRYFLVAANPAGLNFAYIDLVVLGIPMIRAAPQDSVTIDGQDAVFICSALASPEHNIFWEFTPEEGNTTNIINTSGMSNSAKYSIGRSRNDTQLFGQLTVNNVQFADRGTYRCTAENDLGTVNAAASLIVHVRPVINRTSDSATVRLEDMAGVSCLATGYPLPEITWQKDGQDFELGTRVQILSFAVVNATGGGMAPAVAGVDTREVSALGELGVVSVLVFTSMRREDTANYTCNATNSLPETGVLSVVSAPISLTVLAPMGSLTAFFQLRLRPVGNCVVWTGSDREGKFAAIITEVARVVRESCFCNFTSANVIANVFSCISSTDDVVFKAKLIYADTVSADELVEVISQWADGRPFILYEGTLLSVDPTCPTELESLFAEDCVVASQPSITAIAAGVTIGVIGVLLIAIAVVVVTLLALRRRRSQSHHFIPAQQAAIYEDVSGIQLKPVEPEVFQNLAYGHIKHPAAARAQLPAAPTNGTTQEEENKEDHTYEYI